ncbi:MAG: bifunctional folylpolyglutamate synthase/dihydrofolate synthase [Desulfatitalea sp.]|nr:bifunctional folylpolyglutamate synthase/dihydrofolate synthase [Desulfatitalea sp.]
MFRLHRFGIKLGLETISTMLSALGDPQNQFHSIHIAGTNGKGSVAAMLATILRQAGYKVGRYTSPHLERFNERICINDQPIDDEAVVRSCQRTMAIENLPRQPTFFEFTTAMALDEFARQKVQWAVIETGMGGRLDATNVLHPALAVITNISLEHRAYLGSTIADIAGEKAGIIKAHTPVVTGVRQPSASKVIADRAATLGAPLYRHGQEFRNRRRQNMQFDYYGIDHTYHSLRLGLSGDHQVDNAALVLAACELLERNGRVVIREEALRQGLEDTRWPGRLEVAGTAPDIILDGAHNLMSARILSRHLRRYLHNRNITLVIGILEDKPFRNILKDLVASCSRVIVTQPEIDRAIPVHQLEAAAREFSQNVEVRADVGEALRYAVATSAKEDVVCVAGSLYVVGEAKTALANMKNFENKSGLTP